MTWVTVCSVSAIMAVCVLAIARVVMRWSYASQRLVWLRDQHFLISERECADIAAEFCAVVEIDFGFGKEFWVTRSELEQQMLHSTRPIVSNGLRLYPTPTVSSITEMCRRFNLKKLTIHSIN